MLREKLKLIINSVLNEDAIDTACSEAGNIIELGLDVPQELESQLINFMSEGNEAAFVLLSKEVLSKNYLGDYFENIKLIAFLAKKEWLPLKEVARLLSSVPHVERAILPSHFVKALDTADLVCEDLSDGFMDVEDDDLLSDALKLIG